MVIMTWKIKKEIINVALQVFQNIEYLTFKQLKIKLKPDLAGETRTLSDTMGGFLELFSCLLLGKTMWHISRYLFAIGF